MWLKSYILAMFVFRCLQGKTQVACIILLQVLCPAQGLGFQHSAYHTGAPEINVSNHIQIALSLGSGAQCEYSEVSNPKLPLYELTPSGPPPKKCFSTSLAPYFQNRKWLLLNAMRSVGCQYWRWTLSLECGMVGAVEEFR